MLSRRSFLAGSLLTLPGAGVLGGLLRSLKLRDSEFIVSFSGDWPNLFITTFTNGAMEATWGGPTTVADDGNGWQRIQAIRPDIRCEARVKRPGPQELYVDWLAMFSGSNTYYDNFSGHQLRSIVNLSAIHSESAASFSDNAGSSSSGRSSA